MAPKAKTSSSGAGSGGTHVALLRGINLGASNRIKMVDLVEVFAGAGCANVRTYIQSGNVVYEASAKVAKGVPKIVAGAILERFGMKVPVVVRSAAQMLKAAGSNPYLKKVKDPKMLYVGFLAENPTDERLAALDSNRSPGDEYSVLGGEIYMRLGTGAADTKLTNAYFDSALKTVCTMRNWRTVTTLAEMVGEGRT